MLLLTVKAGREVLQIGLRWGVLWVVLAIPQEYSQVGLSEGSWNTCCEYV